MEGFPYFHDLPVNQQRHQNNKMAFSNMKKTYCVAEQYIQILREQLRPKNLAAKAIKKTEDSKFNERALHTIQ